jgi:hypothetical protein
MTSIEVDPDALLALGGVLTEVAGDVQWQATRAGEEAWALGPGASPAALGAVLGDFEHQRQLLGRTLDDLATRVTVAGRGYAEVDLDVGASLRPGGAGGPG